LGALGTVVALSGVHDQRSRSLNFTACKCVAAVHIRSTFKQQLHGFRLVLTGEMQRLPAVAPDLVCFDVCPAVQEHPHDLHEPVVSRPMERRLPDNATAMNRQLILPEMTSDQFEPAVAGSEVHVDPQSVSGATGYGGVTGSLAQKEVHDLLLLLPEGVLHGGVAPLGGLVDFGTPLDQELDDFQASSLRSHLKRRRTLRPPLWRPVIIPQDKATMCQAWVVVE
jgi:hypothetical protein